MTKTAKEIALEHCSSEIRAKAIELAAQGSVPDDDPLWLVFLPTAETRSIPKLLDKLCAIEEAMGLLTTALLENDETIAALRNEVAQFAQASHLTEHGSTLSRWQSVCAVMVGGLVLLGGGALYAVLKPSDIRITSSAALSKTPAVVKPVLDPVEGQNAEHLVLPLTQLKSHLSPANQDRLEHCLMDANDKCTLLIEEPKQEDGSEEMDLPK